jgi:hypothetical protein
MKRLLSVCLVSLLASCMADDDTVIAGVLDLRSQFYFDYNAQPTGQSNSTPDDFSQESWQRWERKLFDDLDSVYLPSSKVDSARLYLFPNPCGKYQSLDGHASGPINLKVVVVNRFRKTLFRGSANGTTNVQMRLDWSVIAPYSDSLYRVYYAFSTKERPFFHTSHADVTVQQ